MTAGKAAGGGAKATTARYRKKRGEILAQAGRLINEQGITGLSVSELAGLVGLDSTSIPYYFRRKEQLAAACFELSLERLEACVAAGEEGASVSDRVARYFREQFDQLARIRREESPEAARLSEMRALKDPDRARLLERYFGLYRRVRGYFAVDAAADPAAERAAATIRAHVLLETSLWLTFWIRDYGLEDFPRVERRLREILETGMLAHRWSWSRLHERPACTYAESEPLRRFMNAATHLISTRGYRGASVEGIAAELNVTKGSFYHHLRAKDDLIVHCHRRSLRTMARTQLRAMEAGGSGWDQLAGTTHMLLEAQLEGDAPLLRSIALQALPVDVRHRVMDESNLIGRRFAGMAADGVSDGSMSAIDPIIASQMIMSLINAAYELRYLTRRWPKAWLIELYAAVMFRGLNAPTPA